MPSHFLNQCWNIVNWTFGNKLQWNFNQNLNILIQEIVFENVVWKTAAILSRPQCVKCLYQSWSPVARFTNCLGTHNWIVRMKHTMFQLYNQITNFLAHVITAEVSWHLQNCDLIWGSFLIKHKYLKDLDYKLIAIGEVGPLSQSMRPGTYFQITRSCITPCNAIIQVNMFSPVS